MSQTKSTKFWAALVSISILALLTSAYLESRADGRLSRTDERLAVRLILDNDCGSCHTLQARGLTLTGKIGPDLTRQAARGRSPQWLRNQIMSPLSVPDQEVVPGFEGKQKLMPRYDRFSDRELRALIDFLRSLN